MSVPVEFTMVGSGAVRNNPHRGGPSQVLLVGSTPLLFDCGRSACTSLARAGIRAEDVNHLFLTHLHFDHIVDAAYLVFVGWNNSRKQLLRVFGPQGTQQFIKRLIRPPFEEDIKSRLGHGKSEFGLDPIVTEIIPPAMVCKAEQFCVEAIAIPHGNIPAFAYRITIGRRKVVICGDGRPTPELTDFCMDADLVAMECSGTKEFLSGMPWGTWHAVPEEIAAFARKSRIQRLLLKHFVIEDISGDITAAERMAQQIRAGFSGEVIAAEDGAKIRL